MNGMTKAERTKQFILETAATIYNEKGLAGTGVDDILAATQLTKGCLYSHFENKEDLTLQVADYLLQKTCDGMRKVLGGSGTVKERVFAYLDVSKVPLRPPIQGGCPTFNMAVEAEDNMPVIKQKVSEAFIKTQKLLAGLLTEGIRKKEFNASLDAEAFSFKMLAATEGGTVICRSMNTNKPMQGLIKSLKEELERYSLPGKT
jgi:TetR/AcrR family transcriptional regulator, transcriptional repressor for nem operon